MTDQRFDDGPYRQADEWEHQKRERQDRQMQSPVLETFECLAWVQTRAVEKEQRGDGSHDDRVENIRRVAEVARLMTEAGLITLVSFISPFRAERRLARDLVPDGEFFLVHIDTPLEVAEQRDPKGLYKKARAGRIPNFTGIGSAYERPEKPDLRIDTSALSADEAANRVIGELVARGIVPG